MRLDVFLGSDIHGRAEPAAPVFRPLSDGEFTIPFTKVSVGGKMANDSDERLKAVSFLRSSKIWHRDPHSIDCNVMEDVSAFIVLNSGNFPVRLQIYNKTKVSETREVSVAKFELAWNDTYSDAKAHEPFTLTLQAQEYDGCTMTLAVIFSYVGKRTVPLAKVSVMRGVPTVKKTEPLSVWKPCSIQVEWDRSLESK